MNAFRTILLAGLALPVMGGSCSLDSNQAEKSQAADESGYSEFEFDQKAIVELERLAKAGDNAALQKLIDHYLFSSGNTESFDHASAVKWLKVGAERRIKGSLITFLYLVNNEDADCNSIRQYLQDIDDIQVRSDIMMENAYVRKCMEM